MNKEKWEIWRTNKFNNDILTEHVATFYDLELAKNFVDYQATLSEDFAITHNGERIGE